MIEMTKYYEEFLRYYKMAKWQQENCNLGTKKYSKLPYDDDLMKRVHIYDVVERKYAGFTSLLLDVIHGYDESHPYYKKMSPQRKLIADSYDTTGWKLSTYLYVFMVHRLTGSGIHYGKESSGYHNSPVLAFSDCGSIKEMVKSFKKIKGPKYTSKGYQIAAFPKPIPGYDKGGDYYICEIVPEMMVKFAKFIKRNKGITFRDALTWLQEYNMKLGIRRFNFQFSAFLADIADFFPDFVDGNSPFMYGKNCLECLNYLAVPTEKMPKAKFYDLVMERICKDTGMKPYNAEDVTCDSIRWIENYVDNTDAYSDIDLDTIFSSHGIHTHGRGRQSMMLELGLVKTFNGRSHPSDLRVLTEAGITEADYRRSVRKILPKLKKVKNAKRKTS